MPKIVYLKIYSLYPSTGSHRTRRRESGFGGSPGGAPDRCWDTGNSLGHMGSVVRQTVDLNRQTVIKTLAILRISFIKKAYLYISRYVFTKCLD